MWASTKALKDNSVQEKAPYEFDEKNPFNLRRRAIDHARPIKVIVLGFGMSGILAGTFFPRNIENLDLVIYEKNPEVGGTWYESKYPGVACDVPSHAYQYTFESNRAWSKYWAGGAEINEYLKAVAVKYDALKYVKFNHKCEEARWDACAGKWNVTFTKPDGEVVKDSADIFVSAVGVFNGWKMPDIAGLADFKGEVMHSATWNSDFDTSNKRVALIGGGSSGIQILPQIQPKATRIDHYMKGRTWIPPAGLGGQGIKKGASQTSAADLELWDKDPKAYLEFRRKIEAILHTPSDVIYKGTANALAFQGMCEDHMRTALAKKPEIFESLKPDFAPACRRLTPGPGYLEALVEDNVEFISTGIEKIDATGIITKDGKHREVDAIICATGFSGFKQMFPIIGEDGVNLQDVWAKECPEAYLSLAPAGMPNYFMMLGPNGGPGVGSTVPFLEAEAGYLTKVIKKIQREWIHSMKPKRSAIADFGAVIDEFFETTVFNDSCRAWWRHNDNGRLIAIWPGSALHGIYCYQDPRWEDFDYALKRELKGNRFNWFGNGYARAQLEEGGNTTRYLDHPWVTLENPLEKPVPVNGKTLEERTSHAVAEPNGKASEESPYAAIAEPNGKASAEAIAEPKGKASGEETSHATTAEPNEKPLKEETSQDAIAASKGDEAAVVDGA